MINSLELKKEKEKEGKTHSRGAGAPVHLGGKVLGKRALPTWSVQDQSSERPPFWVLSQGSKLKESDAQSWGYHWAWAFLFSNMWFTATPPPPLLGSVWENVGRQCSRPVHSTTTCPGLKYINPEAPNTGRYTTPVLSKHTQETALNSWKPHS